MVERRKILVHLKEMEYKTFFKKNNEVGIHDIRSQFYFYFLVFLRGGGEGVGWGDWEG